MTHTKKTNKQPPVAYNLIKLYLRSFFSIKSILEVVLSTVEPDLDSNVDIFGRTCSLIKTPIMTIETECPNSCGLPQILGTAYRMANGRIETKAELIEFLSSNIILRGKLLSKIIDSIVVPQMIFCALVSLFLIQISPKEYEVYICMTTLVLLLIKMIILGTQCYEIENLLHNGIANED